MGGMFGLRLEGKYLFSPTDEFKDLDLTNFPSIVGAFERRIQGWFFDPLRRLLSDEKNFFIAAALECVLVDALSGFAYGIFGDTHKDDFVKFLVENLNIPEDAAIEFYTRFRCGILHQTNIKKSSCLTKEVETLYFQLEDDRLFFNPQGFFELPEKYFESYVRRLKVESDHQIRFRKRFSYLFAYDIEEPKWRAWWAAAADYEKDIQNSIGALFKTYKGSMEGDPNFGINLDFTFFGTYSENELRQLEKEVHTQLSNYEPRIELRKIEAKFQQLFPDDNRVLLEIVYKTKATDTVESYCFVYYIDR
jgi:phage baseplate assembly protein W